MKQAMQIEGLLADHEKYHSDFQIENFIIGHGHVWGQYKQALRELSARWEALRSEDDEIQAAEIEAQRERRKWALSGTGRLLKAIAVRRAERKVAGLAHRKNETQRELAEFLRIAVALKRQIGELTIAKRRELESEMWLHKARRMAALDLISLGGLQRQTAEFIASLPREMRRAVLADLRPENRQRLLTTIE